MTRTTGVPVVAGNADLEDGDCKEDRRGDPALRDKAGGVGFGLAAR